MSASHCSRWFHPRLRWLRWSCLVTLVSGALTFALVWVQYHWQVLHPHYLPFIILITIMTVAAAVTVHTGLWLASRDLHRTRALAWMVLALIPLVFFGFVGLYAMTQWGDRWVPNNLPMNLAKVMGATLMRLEASLEYPNRLETGRLVMFYDRLEHPRDDAEAMDQHLAAMETMLGGSLRGKVFWIRGPLPKLGLSGLSTNGIALGSDTSPPDWRSYAGLDRHELAHAAIDQFRSPGADPPCVLTEGWAQSRCGDTPAALSRDALGNVQRTRRSVCVNSWDHPGTTVIVGRLFVRRSVRRFLDPKAWHEEVPPTLQRMQTSVVRGGHSRRFRHGPRRLGGGILEGCHAAGPRYRPTQKGLSPDMAKKKSRPNRLSSGDGTSSR